MKLYADERESAEVRRAVKDADLIASHLIAYVETRAALARKSRLTQMTDRLFREIKRAFEHDWNSIHRLPTDDITVRRAGDLAEQYGLRAYDSLHLAAGETLLRALHVPITFACFDRTLNEAARDLGLELL